MSSGDSNLKSLWELAIKVISNERGNGGGSSSSPSKFKFCPYCNSSLKKIRREVKIEFDIPRIPPKGGMDLNISDKQMHSLTKNYAICPKCQGKYEFSISSTYSEYGNPIDDIPNDKEFSFLLINEVLKKHPKANHKVLKLNTVDLIEEAKIAQDKNRISAEEDRKKRIVEMEQTKNKLNIVLFFIIVGIIGFLIPLISLLMGISNKFTNNMAILMFLVSPIATGISGALLNDLEFDIDSAGFGKKKNVGSFFLALFLFPILMWLLLIQYFKDLQRIEEKYRY